MIKNQNKVQQNDVHICIFCRVDKYYKSVHISFMGHFY